MSDELEYAASQEIVRDAGSEVPYDDLEMVYKTTQPAWGREVTADLDQKLTKIRKKAYYNEEGVLVVDADKEIQEHLWGLLSYYTRDLRLGNLNYFNNEMAHCQHYLDLAGDFLRDGLIHSFLTSLSRVITMIELSQSKGGFLRNRGKTKTYEKIDHNMLQPRDKGFFGGTRKQ